MHNELGNVHAQLGALARAARTRQRGRGGLELAELNWAIALELDGRTDESVARFSAALATLRARGLPDRRVLIRMATVLARHAGRSSTSSRGCAQRRARQARRAARVEPHRRGRPVVAAAEGLLDGHAPRVPRRVQRRAQAQAPPRVRGVLPVAARGPLHASDGDIMAPEGGDAHRLARRAARRGRARPAAASAAPAVAIASAAAARRCRPRPRGGGGGRRRQGRAAAATAARSPAARLARARSTAAPAPAPAARPAAARRRSAWAGSRASSCAQSGSSRR